MKFATLLLIQSIAFASHAATDAEIESVNAKYVQDMRAQCSRINPDKTLADFQKNLSSTKAGRYVKAADGKAGTLFMPGGIFSEITDAQKRQLSDPAYFYEVCKNPSAKLPSIMIHDSQTGKPIYSRTGVLFTKWAF